MATRRNIETKNLLEEKTNQYKSACDYLKGKIRGSTLVLDTYKEMKERLSSGHGLPDSVIAVVLSKCESHKPGRPDCVREVSGPLFVQLILNNADPTEDLVRLNEDCKWDTSDPTEDTLLNRCVLVSCFYSD